MKSTGINSLIRNVVGNLFLRFFCCAFPIKSNTNSVIDSTLRTSTGIIWNRFFFVKVTRWPRYEQAYLAYLTVWFSLYCILYYILVMVKSGAHWAKKAFPTMLAKGQC